MWKEQGKVGSKRDGRAGKAETDSARGQTKKSCGRKNRLVKEVGSGWEEREARRGQHYTERSDAEDMREREKVGRNTGKATERDGIAPEKS